jgi:hypothetical protein
MHGAVIIGYLQAMAELGYQDTTKYDRAAVDRVSYDRTI